jgi:glutamyl-tRNA synthetase
MSLPRVRFAPSPTGYLHIGGVRTALFNWLWARKTGGAFVLRIEDTDQERSTQQSMQVILDSMTWLGLTWDEGPGVGGAHGPYFQMQRLAIYKEFSEKLIASRKAYRCYCTKEELDVQRAALKERDPKAQFRYPGTCRDRTDQPDKPFVVRFRMPDSGTVKYIDSVFGEIVTPNAAQQDFVLVRSDGVPLYNFGAVVDDLTMGITLVARGRDHMVNTPPQILIYEALCAKPPTFAHLPMMLAPSGEKLSKRHGAVSVAEYRDQGYSPQAVLNYLARFGWSHGDQEVFSLDELIAAFDWKSCGKGDGKFDTKKFLAIEHEHLKSERLTPTRKYAQLTVPFLDQLGLSGISLSRIEDVVPAVRERATTFVDAANGMDFFFRDPPQMDQKAAQKFLNGASAQKLEALHALYSNVDAWTEGELERRTHAWLEAEGLQIKDVAQAARVALTGRSASPGLYLVLFLLGKERSLKRLADGAAIAKGNGS